MDAIRLMFGMRSLDAVVRRARVKLAGGEFDQAQRLVESGLERYPDAEALRELEHSIGRARARAGIRDLREQVRRDDDPHAYEVLISQYLELGMTAEARKEATSYATAHPDRDSPHLLLGEMALQTFLDDLQARDAHVAHSRLQQAATLNPQAIKPRLLLAELYHCVGADQQLRELGRVIAEFARQDPYLEAVLDQIERTVVASEDVPLDGLFERVEADARLHRQPMAWLKSIRRPGLARLNDDQAAAAAVKIVERGDASEIVLLQRNGNVVAHEAETASECAVLDVGLVNVSRAVARTVSRYARDLDLGAFKRCTIQGDFGLVAVGEVSGIVAGARWGRGPEAQRRWERIVVGLQDALGGGLA